MANCGMGATSPLHDARAFNKGQNPLRQLLSGSGQARHIGGHRKPNFLGGGASSCRALTLCQCSCLSNHMVMTHYARAASPSGLASF